MGFVFVWDVKVDEDCKITQEVFLYPVVPDACIFVFCLLILVAEQDDKDVFSTLPTRFLQLCRLKGLKSALEIIIRIMRLRE